MSEYYSKLNHFLVRVFNDILRVEEDSLRTGEFKNISVREMHVIEAVCASEQADDGTNRASDIAKALRVSGGTLTTSVSQLEKKGCVVRKQDTEDKRIVRLYSTKKGKRANEVHQAFHQRMINDVIAAMSPQELDILTKGLGILEEFFANQKKNF